MLGHVMLDLEGLALTAEESELLQHPQVGGVILFTRNYETPAQLTFLISQIRAVTKRRLLIAVDQEGGRVQRFKTGFTLLPPMQIFGNLYDQDPQHATALAEATGWLMAAELLAFDIDFSFAPVLDIDQGISQVIGNRSFHANPYWASELAAAFCTGIHTAGMATVGKHFPGHGSVSADSHVTLPIDERDYAAIEALDLIPFKQLIVTYLDGIMPAHVIYNQLDNKPAGFSVFWLKTVLRERLNFQGAIFSDDLAMAGAESAGNFIERAHCALTAGCNMVLVCNDRPAAISVLEALGNQVNPSSQPRLLNMQARAKPLLSQLKNLPRWQQTVNQLQHFL